MRDISKILPGCIATLEAACEAGWISPDELTRQRFLMEKANEVERLRGAASQPYIEPSRGDLKHIAAQRTPRTCTEREKGCSYPECKERDGLYVR